MKPERAGPRLADPEPPGVPARRVGHRQPAREDLAAGHVDQDAAVRLVLAPAADGVGIAQRRRVAGPAVDHRQAVQMAPIGGLEGRDERRPPARHEAVRPVERAEAGESGVDEPELVAPPGHLVDLDVAGDVASAGQEAGVVAARRLELGRDGRDVAKLPDLHRGADRQAVAVEGQPHGCRKAAEVGVEVVTLTADHHKLAGLIGRDQERGTQAAQSAGKFGVWTARSGSGPGAAAGDSRAGSALSTVASAGIGNAPGADVYHSLRVTS